MATLVPQLDQLVHHYKADPESVYNTWYAGSDARMKAFRAIRLGVKDVVSAIAPAATQTPPLMATPNSAT